MNKYALVIGSQTQGLRGAENDARGMRELLRDHAFDVDLRLGDTATRDGILEGYDQLIAKLLPGDAAVVYYSGHGALVVNQDPTDRLRIMQSILPTDIDRGNASDFRGISTWELSIKLAQLTARTQNVTVIFDSCHSAQMNRDGAVRQAVPRALPHPIHAGFRVHLAALEAKYGQVELDPVGNPNAVRLVACAQTESAFEYANKDGRWTGVFTEALIAILREVGDAPIGWAAIGDAIRERVLRTFVTQRPEVEGPSERRLFSLAIDERTGTVPITASSDRLRIQTGRILGTRDGDVYGVMPLGARSYEETRAIARLRVTEAASLVSTVVLEAWKNGHTALPNDAIAIPIEQSAPARTVMLVAPPAERARIEQAIAAARTLRIAHPNDPRDPRDPNVETTALATLRLVDQQLTIEDPGGPIFPPTRYPDELAETVKNVANLGVAQSIRELVGEHNLSAARLEITWGVVEQGKPREMPNSGASLGLGDRIYVKVKNTGSEPRYIHIFNVGVRGKVTLLTQNIAPAGFCLDHTNPELVLGERDGRLVGLALGWPKGLSQHSFPRIDEIFVFVTMQRVSLRNLETQEYAVRGERGAARGSKLQELLAQMQDGLTRDVGDPEPLEGFLVKQLSYTLHPRQAAMADTLAFQIDENPGLKAAGRSAGAWISGGDEVLRKGSDPTPGLLPEALAIRLGELVVERNHAMFSADIRIDALVCTRSANQAETYVTHTMRFHGIGDEERLPLEHARIFHGPVRDFVDICLWVSRDTTRDRSLADLFKQQATSPEFQDAATGLLSTADFAARPWITAVGASAVLARIAYDLILGVTNTTIGLYRTSFLASENFGVGRHPREGLYRAQDFSFSLLVDAVKGAAT
ncbi:MAG TPA: caspase family protein [Kofleriaceae bacterium]|jgi:hypothetical protein|nr:caspase family protein [Kofleriaceae bacterium]